MRSRRLVVVVFVAFLAIFTQSVKADEAPPKEGAKSSVEVTPTDTNPKAASSLAAAVKDIRAKYDEKKYTDYQEYPLCMEVLDRKRHENMDILEIVLAAQDPEYRDLFKEMAYDYPSTETLKKVQKMAEEPSNVPPKEGEKAPTKVVTFFSGETDIVRLVMGQKGGKSTSGTVAISNLVAGDLVLSTTSLMIKDRRYHKDCWAHVGEVFKSEANKDTKSALIQYRTAKKEKAAIRATSSTCLFCKQGGKFETAGCMTIDPATEILSLHGEKNGYCRFSEVLEQVAGESFVTYNIAVIETGVFYIGKLGSELLIGQVAHKI